MSRTDVEWVKERLACSVFEVFKNLQDECTDRAAVRELEQSLRNRGYDVTVAQASDPGTVTIASKGFDDGTSRDRFLLFYSPEAAACAAGIQAVRFKGPGVFIQRHLNLLLAPV